MKKIKRFELKTYDFFRRNRLRKKYFKSMLKNHNLIAPWQIATIKIKKNYSKNRFRVEASLLFGKKRKGKAKSFFNSKIKIKRKVYTYSDIIRQL